MKQFVFFVLCISTLSIFANGVPRSGTVCQKGYKYTAPINADGRTTVRCNADSSCHTIVAGIEVNNDIIGTTTQTEMTMGQCVPTSACAMVTCGQVRQFMPSNLRGMLASCSATCCKEGVCQKLTNSGEVLQLPGPSPTILPQRPMEYPSFVDSNSNLPSHPDDNTEVTGDSGNVCKKGIKYGAPINADGQKNEYCDADSSCHVVTAELVYRNQILGTTTQTEMDVRQCVETSACQMVTCGQVRRFLPSNLRGSLGSCTARCCKNGICSDLPQNAGVLQVPDRFSSSLPASDNLLLSRNNTNGGSLFSSSIFSEDEEDNNAEAAECALPIAMTRRTFNWPPRETRIGKKQSPKFYLKMKKLKGNRGYKPSKVYKLSVRAFNKKTKIRNLYISLLTNNTGCSCRSARSALTSGASCPVGRLLPKTRDGLVTSLPDGCIQPLTMRFTRSPVKQAFVIWKAPDCRDATITIRVHVGGSDGSLYVDNENLGIERQYLTKVVRARPGRRG